MDYKDSKSVKSLNQWLFVFNQRLVFVYFFAADWWIIKILNLWNLWISGCLCQLEIRLILFIIIQRIAWIICLNCNLKS